MNYKKTSEITVDGIAVTVIRKNIRNLHLRVKAPLGTVQASVPYYVSNADVEQFVASKTDWIRKNVQRYKDSHVTPVPEYETGETIAVWGELYTLEVSKAPRFSMRLTEDSRACLTVKPGSSREDREAFVINWYRHELKDRVNVLLPKWEEYTGMHCSSWTARNMTTRWGTCNTATNKITLNVQLAKHPPECLDYVILHELAHTRVPNHGPEFKAIETEFMPNWREVRKKLNDPSITDE